MFGAGVRNRQGARLWLTLLVVLGFAVQSYSVQTHIHPLAPSRVAAATTPGEKGAPAHRKAPSPLDQGCPLCQAVAHAGHTVLPDVVAVLAPTLSVLIITDERAAPVGTQPTRHGWQSRAPPIA